ncbi:MAG TPA: hypothetical protein VK386_10755 [Acidimicrobiales bacterium]|nr:hypothetical protein [Acidimicrobiales bacterium]
MKFESIAVRLAGITLVASLVLGVTPSVAGARHSSASTAKGAITCSVTGTFTASPALTLGSGKATTLTLQATLSGCTGSSAAAKVTGGTLSGSSVDKSASCVAFENGFPPLTGKVAYKTTSGSFAPTALAFSGGTLGFMATPLAITYPKSGGTGTAKGSFATKSPKLIVDMPVPYSQWVAACQNSTGLATMTITSESTLTA